MSISVELGAACRDLLLGSYCVGCERPGLVLCCGCQGALDGLPARVYPSPCPVGLPPVFSVMTYDRVAQAALIAHKERGRLSLAKPLGRALAVSVLGVLSSTSARPAVVDLVPVPSRRGVVRERGHDPLVRMLAHTRRALADVDVVATVVPMLRVGGGVSDQAGLSARQRAANVSGAFSVRRHHRLSGHHVVVTDDIVTTGATAAEAVRAVETAGAEVLGVAVVAATARRSPSGVSPK